MARTAICLVRRQTLVVLALTLVGTALGPAVAVSAQDGQSRRPTATVTVFALNVRDGPGVSYAVIDWLRQGETVPLAGLRNADASWVQVVLASGRTGWVSAKYLQSDYPLENLVLADGGGDGRPGDNLSGIAPQHVIEGYYSWYLEYARETGNPLVNRAYRTDDRVTPTFKQQVDDMAGQLVADPFLCAQDVPEAFSVGPAYGSDGRAAAVVTTSFTGHSFLVNLLEVDGRWQIDGVMCLRRQ